jgi:hypothetical protein
MPPKGYHMPDSAKRKLSEYFKQYWATHPHYHPSDDVKRKISLANKGRVCSQKERERRSKFAKERYKNPANHPNWRGGI